MSSHGFRPTRGAHTAIVEAKEYVGEGYGVVVDIDLSKFFDRVHHQRLVSRLGQKVEDLRILKLIGLMLKAKVVMPDGTRACTNEGTPQSGALSPLSSNVALDEFDQELARRGSGLSATPMIATSAHGASRPVSGLWARFESFSRAACGCW